MEKSKVITEEIINDKNLEQQVYDHILGLLFKQGVAQLINLSDNSIAQSLGVSRTPVRIALAKLECEGLVVRTPGKGWTIPSLSMKDIEEIFELKELLETHVVRKASSKITPESAETIRNIIDEMKQYTTEKNLKKWLWADERFHDILFELAGNERLRSFIKQINAQYHRFELGFLVMGERMEISYKEHCMIAEAVIAGDSELAARNTAVNLQNVRTNLLNIMETVLIPFLGNEL